MFEQGECEMSFLEQSQFLFQANYRLEIHVGS